MGQPFNSNCPHPLATSAFGLERSVTHTIRIPSVILWSYTSGLLADEVLLMNIMTEKRQI